MKTKAAVSSPLSNSFVFFRPSTEKGERSFPVHFNFPEQKQREQRWELSTGFLNMILVRYLLWKGNAILGLAALTDSVHVGSAAVQFPAF